MSQSTSAESNGKELVQGITGISVSGYKSLYEECSIEVRPLTILAGANSSGKSSIMQPLLLMKQTLEATYDPGALLLNGSNVQFTLAEQIFSYLTRESNNNKISITIEIDKKKSVINKFKKQKGKALEVIETTDEENGRRLTFSTKMTRQDIVALLYKRYQDEVFGQVFLEGKGEVVEKLEWNILRERCFLNLICRSVAYTQAAGQQVPIPMILYDSGSRMSQFQAHIRKLLHVPGLRGNPERTYPTTAIGSEFPGTFENYVASVVNDWQNTNNARLRKLESDLKALGLTDKIEARQVNDVQIELRVSRLPGSNEVSHMVSIADVGLGVSQVLPVLVALLVAEPGQLVYLEQPEVHLHPRAQTALAEILADAAKRGVRVVLETHSELLLLAVQSLVAEGKLSSDLVKLHWFTRREDGVTKVSSADLDEAGAFGDWPEDFGDVSMKLESRYLDAAESRLWNRSHGG
jgi:predicted ATPase